MERSDKRWSKGKGMVDGEAGGRGKVSLSLHPVPCLFAPRTRQTLRATRGSPSPLPPPFLVSSLRLPLAISAHFLAVNAGSREGGGSLAPHEMEAGAGREADSDVTHGVATLGRRM